MGYFAPKQDEPGTIKDFGQAAIPGGWLACDGAAASRAVYAALFAAIGTVWGAGDGSTTFNVPDLRGRSRVGTGQGAGLTNRALAASGGAETHPLVDAENGPHVHQQRTGAATASIVSAVSWSGTAGSSASGAGPGGTAGSGTSSALNTVTAGSGTAHNTMHPFRACTTGIRC